ncbi:MAG: FAD-linked oxidase C-terminal domain-containing protein [Thermodesulfobacteriota bacterium]
MDYLDKLKAIVGPENVTADLVDCLSYSRDMSVHVGAPDVVVFPGKAEEVAAVVKVAAEHKTPIIPRGSGTSVTGAALAPQGGILLDLVRLNKILEINLKDGYVRVEPGVICNALNAKLAPTHFFPPDPGSAPVATLGGMISTNASGIRAVKYGTTKDYVKGLKVVLADGGVIKTGSLAPKHSTGFDLTYLFTSAEGTLGVIVEAVLKILPVPEYSLFAKIDFPSLEDAGLAVEEILTSGLPICTCEVLDRVSIDIMAGKLGLDIPQVVQCQILIEIDGHKEAVESDRRKIDAICRRRQAVEINWTVDPAERLALSRIRHGLVPAMSRIKPFYRLVPIVEDFGVPMSAIPATIRAIQEIGQRHNFPIATFGHIGDGNLHATFIMDVRDPGQWSVVKKIALEFVDLTVKFDGTLSAEHGLGMAKSPYIRAELGETAQVMQKIKDTLDPLNILNPGKMIFRGAIADILDRNAFDALYKTPETVRSFGDQVDKEILACIQCGFCQAGCPTFGRTKLESLNARGRITLAYNMLTGQIKPSADLARRLYQCMICLNCKYTCPAQVDLSPIIHAARERLVREGFMPEIHGQLLESIAQHGNPFAESPTKRADVYPADFQRKEQAETLLFLGCVASYQDLKIIPGMIRIAAAAGEDFTALGGEEVCCGYLAYLVGDMNRFRETMNKVVARAKKTKAKRIVATCAGCYKTLHDLYPKYGADWNGLEVRHAIEYLEARIKDGRIKFKEDEALKVAYHDPCDIGRHMGLYEPPRNVLKAIPGLKLIEFPQNRTLAKCCGGGGGVKAFDNTLSNDIAFERVLQAVAIGAEAIVSACPSCKNSLNQGATRLKKEKKGKIKVMDLTELVAGRMA